MNKKAQSLSINTIIISILALLVLVILVFILTNKTGILVKETSQCGSSIGGTCSIEAYTGEPGNYVCDPEKGYMKHPTADDCENGPCCQEIKR